MFARWIFSFILTVTMAVFMTSPGHADDIRTETVRFAAGESGTSIKGAIKGYNIVDYVIGADAGQTMVVNMTTDNLASYFNILYPGETDEAFYVGSVGGNSYTGSLPYGGEYKVRVYMMRSAARREETANYTLDISITSVGAIDGLAEEATSSEPATRTETVKFAPGTNGTALSSTLGGGEAVNYVVGARNGQFLNVTLLQGDPTTHFNIFLPDGELLYESNKGGANGRSYRGQLFMDGDNTITVYSLGAAGTNTDFELDIRID